MGSGNGSPGAFSDGGEFLDAGRAIDHGRSMLEEGAAILDVGGESTRPGAAAVDVEEESRRVIPVVEGLVAAGATVSIDTSKARVAARALDAGAEIVNDVTALGDGEMAPLVAARGCGLVLMHMQGSPRTMQESPSYGDVVVDVRAFLTERLRRAVGAGIEERRIWVDPGIGFGKTVEHNLELIRRLAELRELGRPIVLGTSRKSFIGKLTGRDVDQRLGGTIASNVLGLLNGADLLRVHEVAATRDAIKVAGAIAGRSWRRPG